MIALVEFQRLVSRLVCANGKPTNEQISALPLKGNSTDKIRQLGVHINTIHNSLVEVLESNYPLIFRFLGEGDFRKVALEFIKSSLPNVSALSAYGAGFDKKLDASLSHIPWLEDLAYLEWELLNCVSTSETLEPASGKIFNDEDVVPLDEGVRLLQADYDLMPLIDQIKRRENIQKQINKKASYYLIYRHTAQAVFRGISDIEYNLLRQIKAEKTILEIAKEVDVTVNVLKTYVQGLVKLGIVK
jgi:hypothetical protein